MKLQLTKTIDKLFNEKRLETFFYGPVYPIIVALLTTLSFVMNFVYLGLFAISFFASIIFIKFKDITPIFPLLFSVVMCFRDYGVMNSAIPYILLSPALISLVLKLFIYPIQNFKPGKLFYALIGVSVALFLGGINRNTSHYVNGLAPIISLGLVMLLIYVLFSAYIAPPKNLDLKKYFCYVLTIVGLTCVVHVSYYYLNRHLLKNQLFATSELGWANVNCCATAILISICSCFYLLTRCKNILPCLIAIALFYFGIVLTKSDGVLGISIALLPVLSYFSYKHMLKSNRKLFLNIILSVLLLICLCLLVLFSIKGFNQTLSDLTPRFSDSDRLNRYKEAYRLFLENPIFGVGLGYSSSGPTVRTPNFHSVIAHTMASLGVVGLIAYGFYYYSRFSILNKRNSAFSLFMMITFIAFECYALIDTCEFNAIPLMTIMTVLMVVVEYINKRAKDYCSPLPLYLK